MRVFIMQANVVSGFLGRFFTTNLYGIFALVLVTYFLSHVISGVQPLSFSELMNYIYDLESSYKIAILSSLLTVIGFLIAFQTATTNLKKQLQAQLRVETARDIDFTYSRINELILSIKIYAEMNLDIIKKIKNGSSEDQIGSDLLFISSKTQEFNASRTELGILSVRIYDFYGRHFSPLFAAWNSFRLLQDVNESVRRTTEKMWIPIPHIDLKIITYKDRYLSSIDEEAFGYLIEQCEESHKFIAGVTGYIKGNLISPIAEFNFWSLLNFLKNRKLYTEYFQDVDKIREKYSEQKEI